MKLNRIMKRVCCIVLAVIISITPCVTDFLCISHNVYAETKYSVMFYETLKMALRSIGYIVTKDWNSLFDYALNFFETSAKSKTYKKDDGKLYMDITVDTNGKWHLDSEFMQDTKNMIEEYIEKNPDYYICPTTKYTNVLPSRFGMKECYEDFLKFFNENEEIKLIAFDWNWGHKGPYYCHMYYAFENNMFIDDWTGVGLYCFNKSKWEDIGFQKEYVVPKDANGDGIWESGIDLDHLVHSSWECSKSMKQADNYQPSWGMDFSNMWISRDGNPYYVFKDRDTAIDYQYGLSHIYRCTPTWDGNGDCVVDAFSETAYQQMIDAIKAGISEALKDSGGLTPEDIQRIIDAILGIGGTVGEGTEEQKKANSWLEKIYNKLCDIKAGTSDALLNKLDDIESQLKQIKVLLGLELIWDVITDLLDRVGNVVDALVMRFPFSIPWDIKLLYDFCAHTPETPRFEIPVNINLPFFSYQSVIEIDIGKYKAFDVLHKISRGFLTLWFIAVLLSYTRKIVQGLFSQ